MARLDRISQNPVAGAPDESPDLAQEDLNFKKEVGIPNVDYYDIRNSARLSQVAIKIILRQPLSYLKYHLITSLPFLFPSTIDFAKQAYDSTLHQEAPFKEGAINSLSSGNYDAFFKEILQQWWKVLERLCWFTAYFIALFAIWNRRKSFIVWSFIFTIGYIMLLAGPASGPRLSFQAWPFMFILFSEGGFYVFELFLSKHKKKLN